MSIAFISNILSLTSLISDWITINYHYAEMELCDPRIAMMKYRLGEPLCTMYLL